MKLEDKLIKETSELLGIDLNIVDEVIHFKSKAMYEALSTSRSVEDSGLGTFRVREKVLEKALFKHKIIIDGILKALKEDISERKRFFLLGLQETRIADEAYLKTKLENEV